MPPKRTSKTRQKGMKRSKPKPKPQKESKSPAPATTSPFCTQYASMLDFCNSHPHILSRIIDHCPRPSLLVFMRCAQFTYKATVIFLYRHLAITCDDFTNLIETGRRGSSSSSSGRGFSPSLHESLREMQTLHLKEYSPYWEAPEVPWGSLAGVKRLMSECVRQNGPDAEYGDEDEEPYLRPHPLDASSGLRLAVKDIVQLMDYHASGPILETIIDTEWMRRAESGDKITYVFLPIRPHVRTYLRGGLRRRPVDDTCRWSQCQFGYIWDLYKALFRDVRNLTIVGLEYFGPHSPSLPSSAVQAITSASDPGFTILNFREWLDQYKPGTIWTIEEEADYRELDKRPMAELAGSYVEGASTERR